VTYSSAEPGTAPGGPRYILFGKHRITESPNKETAMRLTLRALAVLAAVLPLLGAAVRAQDAAGNPAPSRARDVEPAATSRLTGITLPEGALRVTDAKMLGEFNTSLKTIATQGGFALGQTEALLWGGPAHTSARNKELKDALTQALAKSGYNYQAAGETDLKEGKATLFLAAKTGAGQATLGIFVANDGYLALAWGAITPKGDKETPKAADAPSAKPQPSAGKGPCRRNVLCERISSATGCGRRSAR
jgi:hypothetical protein